ncbi:MAG: hypothetical protein MUF04_08800 [Akkermansiaceae bacterium]|jgi:hypothetical protein|nr:hypothetical protein [Akkermansiaceae bacterium]
MMAYWKVLLEKFGSRARRIEAARRQARMAHQRLCHGLQTMADIVPALGPASLALSARAMELLDRESELLVAVRRARKAPRRERSPLLESLREIGALERAYEEFQQAALAAVYEQAVRRVDAAPVATHGYRAVFTVLVHRLPPRLWPAMNRILAKEVRLWVRCPGGDWQPARKTGVRYGRELVFSRENLERAAELRLAVGGHAVSEFTVEHGVDS